MTVQEFGYFLLVGVCVCATFITGLLAIAVLVG